jgi:hypothetical protein
MKSYQFQREDFKKIHITFIQCDVTLWIQICVGIKWDDKNIQFPHVMIIGHFWGERFTKR